MADASGAAAVELLATLDPGTVMTVQGSGGVVFDMDVPKHDTHAEERIVGQFLKGELFIVTEDPKPRAARGKASDDAEG